MRRSKDEREQQTHLANHETDNHDAKTVLDFEKKSGDAGQNRKMEKDVWVTNIQDFMQYRCAEKG